MTLTDFVAFAETLHSLTVKQILEQRFPIFFSSLPTFDVADPQLPATIYYWSLPQLYRSARSKKKVCMSSHVLNFTENISEELCGPLKNSAVAYRLNTSVLN